VGAAGLALPAAPAGADDLRQPGLRIVAERHFQSSSGTLVVYGDGTGIWNHRLQFRMSPSGLDAALHALEAARFREMPDTFGSGKKWLIRRVSVRSGGFAKDVLQIRDGEQSKELRDLTDRLFEIASPLAQTGVTAADLPDGLRKLASGELAPQSLRLIAHVKPRAGQAGTGFLVKIEDGRGTRQEYRGGAYSEARDLALTAGTIRELAGVLAEGGPSTLPANLHAEVYTELAVRVLDQRKAVLARPLSGTAPPGERPDRERFERLVARLEPLLRTP
jgi:hypothetical protein